MIGLLGHLLEMMVLLGSRRREDRGWVEGRTLRFLRVGLWWNLLLSLLKLLQLGYLGLVVELLLLDVVLHVTLDLVDVRGHELFFLVLLLLQLLHSLVLVQLHLSSHRLWLLLPVSSAAVLIMLVFVLLFVVQVVPLGVLHVLFLHLDSPVLHDFIASLYVLVPEVLQDGICPLLQNGPPQGLQGVPVQLQGLQRLMQAEQGRKLAQIVVDKVQGVQAAQIVSQSDGYLPDLVVAQVDNLQVGIGPPAELFHICDLIHVQMHLLQLREVLKDRRHSGQTVSIQREVGQVRQVHLVFPNLLEFVEKA
jgi:hypothetical protein